MSHAATLKYHSTPPLWNAMLSEGPLHSRAEIPRRDQVAISTINFFVGASATMTSARAAIASQSVPTSPRRGDRRSVQCGYRLFRIAPLLSANCPSRHGHGFEIQCVKRRFRCRTRNAATLSKRIFIETQKELDHFPPGLVEIDSELVAIHCCHRAGAELDSFHLARRLFRRNHPAMYCG